MISTTKFLLILYSSLAVDGYVADLADRKQAYCGSKLTKILSEFCIAYYSPPEYRQKRQIVEECCHNKCTLEYLLGNYCKTVNNKALDNFKMHGDARKGIETTTAWVPQLRNRRLSVQEDQSPDGQQESIIEDKSLRLHKKRGKRNCDCRNRRKIKNMKRTIRVLKKMLSKKKLRTFTARYQNHKKSFENRGDSHTEAATS